MLQISKCSVKRMFLPLERSILLMLYKKTTTTAFSSYSSGKLYMAARKFYLFVLPLLRVLVKS